jgi:hypothetical protein
MRFTKTIVAALAATGIAVTAIAAAPPPAQVQAPAAQRLVLVDIPRATGPKRDLFNARDLSNWQPWLGYADPSQTYLEKPAADAIGRRNAGDFAVRTVDGRPALWIKGETWGSLVNDLTLSDYHLRLEYKWGAKRYAPRVGLPPNNGLLYHTHGTPGTVFGTWQPAIEFEIMQGSTGMAVMVGGETRARTTTVEDRSIIAPHLRYRLNGAPVELANPGRLWNVENARDVERPAGEWNVVDLYVLGDRAVHVLNGVPVMVLTGISTVGADGTRRPLTAGRIQLQSEGAETWFRSITVEPIRSLPRVVAR